MKVMLVVQATKPKKRTAEQKAHDSMKYWDKRQKHESAVYRKMFSKAQGYDFDSHFEKNQIKKKKLIRKRDNCLKLVDAANKRKKQAENNYKKAKDKYDRIVTQRIDLSNKLAEIAEHNTGWKNEGKCAIYRSDGKGEIIYISPADGESESVSSNITSYPVDEGAPYSSYARVNSKGATVAGIIVGKDKADSYRKWHMLSQWNSSHVRLTYRGDFCYKHYLIANMNNDYKNLRDNIEVSLTFQFVYQAKITTSNDSKHHRKSSKASKSVAGNRTKKYTAITIKSGDTLWALSKKYGSSVQWMARVNHIKNPNLIYPGNKIRVA